MRGSKTAVRPGVWHLRVFVGRDPATNKPKQSRRTFTGTKHEAESALAAFVTEVERGTADVDRTTILDDFLDRCYRKWLDEGLSPNTVRHVRSVLSAALQPAVKWGVVHRAVTEQASPPPLRLNRKRAIDVLVIRDLVTAADSTNPTLSARSPSRRRPACAAESCSDCAGATSTRPTPCCTYTEPSSTASTIARSSSATPRRTKTAASRSMP